MTKRKKIKPRPKPFAHSYMRYGPNTYTYRIYDHAHGFEICFDGRFGPVLLVAHAENIERAAHLTMTQFLDANIAYLQRRISYAFGFMQEQPDVSR